MSISSVTGRNLRAALGLVLSLTVIACSPAQPSAVVGLPTPLLPIGDAVLSFSSQPIVLVTQNATISGTISPTYTFEVATDSAFAATKVQTKDNVAQGGSGQTSVALDSLATGKDYYWHVRAQGGGTTGAFSSTSKFTVVALTPPTPVSPANGTVVGSWPTLTVANVQSSGPTGPLGYQFDISTSASFTTITVTGSVAETATQTSFTPSGQAPASAMTFYWRATATDLSNGAKSPSSAAQSFTLSISQAGAIAAQEGQPLWPGVQPPGNNGSARLGDSWNVQTVISFHGATHVTPTIDELRVFDLLDRGFGAQGAIDWINSHGYFTNAAWYASAQVVGFDYEYIAFINGRWDLVFKGE
jgi:hypothetical protein